MLPLVAVSGDPANESFAGAMQPTPKLQRCPYLLQVGPTALAPPSAAAG